MLRVAGAETSQYWIHTRPATDWVKSATGLTGALATSRLAGGSVADAIDLDLVVTPATVDTIVPYLVRTASAAHRFVFFMSSSTGRVQINRINADGTIGARTYHDTWTLGWTSAAAVASSGGTYLAIIKKSTGRLHTSALAQWNNRRTT